jgi:MFS family permease
MRLEKRDTLLVSFFSQFSYLFALQTIPPILPTLIKEFGLRFTIASSLMWLVALPGLLLAILGGLLTEKYGVKRLSIAGTAVMTASSALSFFSTSIPFLQICRLLLGIGGALVIVSAPALIFQWFEKRELGIAMGIFGLTMPLATVVSFNSQVVIANGYGWRAAFQVTTVVNILAFALCLLLAKERSTISSGKTSGLAPLRKVNIWILGVIWAFFNMAVVGYSTWGKTIFTGHGLPAGMPDLLASMIMLGTLTTPLTGFISDRLGGRRRFIILATVAMFLTFPLFPFVEPEFLVVLGLILGLLVAFLPPALFALPEEILGAGKAALGWGVLSTFMNLGFILGPLSVGYVLDTSNSTSAAFFLLSFFALTALFMALVLRSS